MLNGKYKLIVRLWCKVVCIRFYGHHTICIQSFSIGNGAELGIMYLAILCRIHNIIFRLTSRRILSVINTSTLPLFGTAETGEKSEFFLLLMS